MKAHDVEIIHRGRYGPLILYCRDCNVAIHKHHWTPSGDWNRKAAEFYANHPERWMVERAARRQQAITQAGQAAAAGEEQV